MNTTTIIETYAKGLKNGSYTSDAYSMAHPTAKQRELKKTYYIKDKKERLKRVREVINNDYLENEILRTQSQEVEYKMSIVHKDSFSIEYENPTMFYGCETEKANKRMLEIECYLQDIFNVADELNEIDTNKAINYLIDQQFIYHTGIFDNEKKDLKYRGEYNAFIFDLIQIKINEVSNIKIQPIQETIKEVKRKPLKWNADKDTIGTLFGLLIKEKIITGSQADVKRVLLATFSNLKQDAVKKSIGLIKSEKEAKIYHDTETIELVQNWVEYLKTQLK